MDIILHNISYDFKQADMKKLKEGVKDMEDFGIVVVKDYIIRPLKGSEDDIFSETKKSDSEIQAAIQSIKTLMK